MRADWRDDKGPMRVNEGPGGLGRICDEWRAEAEARGAAVRSRGWVTGWASAGPDIRSMCTEPAGLKDEPHHGPAEFEAKWKEPVG